MMEASVTVPVEVRMNLAESEARKSDLLSETLTWVTSEAASADSGVEAEGREVVIVSETLARVAAVAF